MPNFVKTGVLLLEKSRASVMIDEPMNERTDSSDHYSSGGDNRDSFDAGADVEMLVNDGGDPLPFVDSKSTPPPPAATISTDRHIHKLVSFSFSCTVSAIESCTVMGTSGIPRISRGTGTDRCGKTTVIPWERLLVPRYYRGNGSGRL